MITINKLLLLLNGMWFSMVCTFIDNDMHQHSGQNVVDSQDTGYVSLLIRAQILLNHILICFLPVINSKKTLFSEQAEKGIV